MAGRHDTTEEIELGDGLSDGMTKVLDASQTQSAHGSQRALGLQSALASPTPTLASISECIIFTRQEGNYAPAKQYRVKNSLLAGVGFLELANAGDFAANVWNEIPVPRFAVALMVLGGSIALAISLWAFKDAKLSRRNILLLREERRFLRTQREDHIKNIQLARDTESQLNVNFREMGTELVDRFGMDIVMGFGAILVGIGTFMAIGGANHRVFMASNLLSGYIGNAAVALYGTVNAAWSAYVWRRAYRHGVAGSKELKGDIIEGTLKRRIRSVKTHAAINGVTGTIAGAASLITATKWWGYPILVPCIVSSILCNYMWRHKIGYDRPLVRHPLNVDKISLIEELKFVTSARHILQRAPLDSLPKLISDPVTLHSVVQFLFKEDLFEDFCIRLLQDASLSTSLFGPSEEELTIDTEALLRSDKLFVPRLLEIAQTTVGEKGPTQFKYRERYLLEALGCYLCTFRSETVVEKS
jgi:hypothetical protein